MPIDTVDAPLIVVDKFGRRYINSEKIGENWFALNMDSYPLSVGASQTVQSGFSVPSDPGLAGDFEVAGMVGYGTAPFRMSLSEVGVDANAFMNQPIHHNFMSGLAGLPVVFAETMFFIAGSFVQTTITNLSSTLTNKIRLTLIGRKFNSEMTPEVRQRRQEVLANRPTRPFWLTLDTTTAAISAGSTAQEFFLTMPSGSHFVAENILTESTFPFEVAMFDGQSGRNLTYAATSGGYVDSRMLSGTGGLPARTLGSPIIQPRRAIRLLINDLGNNGTNTIYFTVHGRRMRMVVG